MQMEVLASFKKQPWTAFDNRLLDWNNLLNFLTRFLTEIT